MKSKIYALVAFFLLLSSLSPLPAQQSKVKVALDSTYVIVGMPTTIHLEALVPQGQAIQFPDFTKRGGVVAYDDSASYLLELAEDKIPAIDTVKADEGGLTTLRQDVEVFCFDSATLFIPPFAFVTSQGDTLSTNSLALRVVVPFDSIQIDPAKFCDIKDVVDPEFVIWDYIWWVLTPLLILLAAAAAWFGWRYYQQHKKDAPVVVKKEKPLPPHVIAMNALEELAGKKLWQQGKDKQYQTELTDILRQYIEARFGVPAMEKTSDEILDELYELAETQKASLVNLKQVLTLADFVKFAKFVPLADESQLSFMNAKMFVEQTKRAEDVAAQEKSEPKPAQEKSESPATQVKSES